jgi:hypothetical protein
VTTELPPVPPAGWYPDPSGSGAQRYWDGNAWAPAVETITPDPEQPHAAFINPPTGSKPATRNALQGLPIEDWLRKFGGPAGLVLACIFLASRSTREYIDIPILRVLILLVAIACLAGALLWISRLVTNNAVGAESFSTEPQSDEVRQRRLQDYLSRHVATTKGRIESMTDYSAVVIQGHKVNHVLHLLISVFLCGLWLPIWLVLAMTGGEKRTVLTVDQCGNVNIRR